MRERPLVDMIHNMKLVPGERFPAARPSRVTRSHRNGSLVSGMQRLAGEDGAPVVDQGVGELSQSLH